MSFPRYPKYKDSGVEWLGEVPEGWETWKISHAFGCIGSGTTPPSDEAVWYDEGTIPWVTTGELRENVITETGKCVTVEAMSKYSALRLHPEGSVAIAMYGATIGRLGIFGVAATTNQACCVLSLPKALNSKFVFYWFTGFKNILIDLYASGGGQSNINQQIIAGLRIPAPIFSEQQTIAAFLDRETAKIDALVAEQENLIALLKEKRQAVISHAVTKGLDPTVPMKDSGIEWLGKVPAHWVIGIKLNGLALEGRNTFVNGPFGSDLLASELILEGVPVVYIRDLRQQGYVRVSQWCVSEEKAMALEFCSVMPGDILIAKVGDPPGLAVIYPEDEKPAIVTQDVIRIRPSKSKIQAEFLIFLLNSSFGKTAIDNISVESTRTRVSLGDYKRIRISIPPLGEQEAIVSYLNTETAKLDDLTTEAHHTIDLLKERRSALISAAVTGKINVRGYLVHSQPTT